MHGRRLSTTEEIICIKTDDSDEALERLRSWANKNNVDLTEIEIGSSVTDDHISESRQTLGVTVGGDGAFLEGIRAFGPRQIPLFGINTGTLAFLARVQPDEVEAALDEVLRGRARISDRQQLHAEGGDLDATGVNDVMVEPTPPERNVDRKICSLHVFSDGEYVGRYDGSGLAVNTPTGSTGLALSAEGPVHDPSNNLSLQITPLHTHTIGVRPVVVSAESEITIVPDDEVDVLVDGGRFDTRLDEEDVLQITGAEYPAHVVRTTFDDDFFTAVTKKLGWDLRDAEENGPEHRIPNGNGNGDFYEHVEKVASEAARSAGEPLRELHGRVERVEVKSNKSDIVTEADYQSEHIITTVIKNEFPNHGIMSEEDVEKVGDGKYQWMIDPLDGTGNFAHGNPNYSVSISLLEDGVPVVGVVYSPETDELFSAIKGRGAYQNGHKISTTNRDQLNESMLLSGYDPKGEFLQQFYGPTRGIRRIGSAALNLCYIAAGSADGMWEYDTYPWDVAAGLLIVREAGGTVTDHDCMEYKLDVEALDDDRTPLLASNGPLHDELCEQIADAGLSSEEDDVKPTDSDESDNETTDASNESS